MADRTGRGRCLAFARPRRARVRGLDPDRLTGFVADGGVIDGQDGPPWRSASPHAGALSVSGATRSRMPATISIAESRNGAPGR